MVRKLASYLRQNGLAVALRELGRIERSLFVLDWLQNVDLRHRVQTELNKGEARNALARAVFFNRLGEFRDRGFRQQHYRASGLNLLTAAIVLWNTVYLSRAIEHLRDRGEAIDETLLASLSPLGRDHINLTGDYVWSSGPSLKAGEYRALRDPADPWRPILSEFSRCPDERIDPSVSASPLPPRTLESLHRQEPDRSTDMANDDPAVPCRGTLRRRRPR